MGIDVTRLNPALETAVPTWLDIAITQAGSTIAVLATSGAKQGMTDGISPDDVPFKPIRPRINGGDKPLLDKGLLRASIGSVVENSELIMTANSPGARLHQFGGTVLPVKGKYLAIPISKEAKRTTGPRSGSKPFPRPLFVVKGVLCESVQKGRGKKKVAVVVPHYKLVKSVTIVARPYLGVSDATAVRIGEAVAVKYVKLVKSFLGGGP